MVYACFLLSGFAALAYQASWIRSFAVVFGTAHLAVALVLAAYMGGLAAGAAWMNRWIDRIRNPLRLYAKLEIAIAAYALVFPLFAGVASFLLPLLAGVSEEMPATPGRGQHLYVLVSSFLVLAPPTVLMGATLPILVAGVVNSDENLGTRVANLYSVNTAGAVVGTVLAGFVLLPTLGLNQTLLVGAAANLLAATIAWRLASSGPQLEIVKQTTLPEDSGARLLKILMLCSGALAFYYEILWTRLLSHVLGGSAYAYATMLAAFLSGIAIGGFVGGWFARNRASASRNFVIVQVMIGVCSGLVYAWLERHSFGESGLRENAAIAFAVILPGAVLLGTTYPLAVRSVAAGPASAGSASAGIYAWNTSGAILGAFVAGFYIIPQLGFALSIKLAVVANIVIGLAMAARISRTLALLPLASLILAVLVYAPQRPDRLVGMTSIVADDEGTELFYGVGRSATIFLKQIGGYFYLRSDGRPEASIAASGVPPERENQAWLGMLPAAARPDAESALVVGLGGGVVIAGLPDSIKHIDVVEIEPRVIEANRTIAALRREDPLAESRVRLITNDARSAMLLTSRRYDLVISQPSHPWTSGSSHLYTTEFVRLAKARLAEGGVFLQWINGQFVTEDLLRSATATLLASFDYVQLYQVEPTVLMLLASDDPIAPEDGLVPSFREHGMATREDVLATWVLDASSASAFADGRPVVSDNRNMMAFHSLASGDGLTAADIRLALRDNDPLAKFFTGKTRTAADLQLPHLARVMVSLGQTNRLAELVAAMPTGSLRDLVSATALQAGGRMPNTAFASAYRGDPSNTQAAFGLVSRYLAELGAGEDVPQLVIDATDDLSTDARAVLDGWILGRSGNWAGLSQLEDRLANAKPSDLWYREAQRLRCDWRIAMFQQSGDRELLESVIDISDASVASMPGIELRLRRAAASFLLEDYDRYVESLSSVVDRLEQQAVFVDGSADLVRAQAHRVLSTLDRVPHESRGGRHSETRRQTERLITSLEQDQEHE